MLFLDVFFPIVRGSYLEEDWNIRINTFNDPAWEHGKNGRSVHKPMVMLFFT